MLDAARRSESIQSLLLVYLEFHAQYTYRQESSPSKRQESAVEPCSTVHLANGDQKSTVGCCGNRYGCCGAGIPRSDKETGSGCFQEPDSQERCRPDKVPAGQTHLQEAVTTGWSKEHFSFGVAISAQHGLKRERAAVMRPLFTGRCAGNSDCPCLWILSPIGCFELGTRPITDSVSWDGMSCRQATRSAPGI